MVVRLEFRSSNGAYQLRGAVRNDGSTWKASSWFNLSDAPHALEVDWCAATAPGANNGSLTLWIDGVQKGVLSRVDNDTRGVDRIRLGAIAGLDAGIIAVGGVPLLAMVTLRQHLTGTAGADPATLVTIGNALVEFYNWTFLLGPGLVCGTNTVLMAYLMYSSSPVLAPRSHRFRFQKTKKSNLRHGTRR